MAMTTLANMKALLQISDTSKDALITMLIPMIEGKVYEYCNTKFYNDDDEQEFPVGLELDLVPIFKYHMEKSGKLENSESIPGGISVQYKTEAEIYACLNIYRKVYRDF